LKRLLKRFIIYLIEKIEAYEYRNYNPDEQDITKKISDIISLETYELLVQTDYGYVPVEEINLTQPFTEYKLLLEDGSYINCADNHIVFTKDYYAKTILDLHIGEEIITRKGTSIVKSIEKTGNKLCMYDLTINSTEKSYFTGNILSHNTVSAAIVLLHYCLFNNDKNIMVVANKGKTVKEIVRKIKDIYKLLPFFLQQGIINWNESSIFFENGSRIQTENRTAEPSIGFTIDFLYLDEFAKVPDNIIRSYYGTIVPVVSAVENSKIVITSTPDGYNLFHDLLIDAERPEGDPEKNDYEALRVYWWQKKGRRDTKIFPLAYKLKEYGIERIDIENFLVSEGYKISNKKIGKKLQIMVEVDLDLEKTQI